ncbi:hypothetical protein ABH931_002751 [Streptacidiphilus sp. MAP12-33]|uniref:hypothetical protein n=1 Tax=Streptacidiphilus sp. MAP12-33 TaxID=3156266 RepID=UPI003514D344
MNDVTTPWILYRPEFLRLAGLAAQADSAVSMMSTWDAGEWGLAVEDLADLLSEHHTPLLRADRAAVLGLAEVFDVSGRTMSALRWCPDLESEDEWWREVEGLPRASAIADELIREIAPGHALYGVPLAPWLECGACDDVLVRLDDENARTGSTPYKVAVVHVGWSRRAEEPPWPATIVFDRALDALDRLEACFRTAGTDKADA